MIQYCQNFLKCFEISWKKMCSPILLYKAKLGNFLKNYISSYKTYQNSAPTKILKFYSINTHTHTLPYQQPSWLFLVSKLTNFTSEAVNILGSLQIVSNSVLAKKSKFYLETQRHISLSPPPHPHSTIISIKQHTKCCNSLAVIKNYLNKCKWDFNYHALLTIPFFLLADISKHSVCKTLLIFDTGQI